MRKTMKFYKINEIFYSIQGEGLNTGTPAVFIRFSGCNLKCPFCDTEHNDGKLLTWGEIREQIMHCTPEILPPLVVLTGGEPTLTVDDELCEKLAELFSVVAMESNGTHRPPVNVSFLTISPKSDFVLNAETVVDSCNELKIVFDGKHCPEPWVNKIKAKTYFLQPCDKGNYKENEKILRACIRYIKEHPHWRLSLQTQKIIKVR